MCRIIIEIVKRKIRDFIIYLYRFLHRRSNRKFINERISYGEFTEKTRRYAEILSKIYSFFQRESGFQREKQS